MTRTHKQALSTLVKALNGASERDLNRLDARLYELHVRKTRQCRKMRKTN